jgi:hypothetical protein
MVEQAIVFATLSGLGRAWRGYSGVATIDREK